MNNVYVNAFSYFQQYVITFESLKKVGRKNIFQEKMKYNKAE